jgi:hypothetical protein
MRRRFVTLDAFTGQRFAGNAFAVVIATGTRFTSPPATRSRPFVLIRSRPATSVPRAVISPGPYSCVAPFGR